MKRWQTFALLLTLFLAVNILTSSLQGCLWDCCAGEHLDHGLKQGDHDGSGDHHRCSALSCGFGEPFLWQTPASHPPTWLSERISAETGTVRQSLSKDFFRPPIL